MPEPILITAGYAFTPLDEERLSTLRRDFLAFGHAHDLRGLTLLAAEGVNGTVCGTAEAIAAWKEYVMKECGPIVFKDSAALSPVFKRWSVKIKPEIVAIKRDTVKPHGKRHHLSPQKWHKMLQGNDVIIVDARNHFEVELGKFLGAIDPQIQHFSEFPDYVQHSGIARNKKILLYCTGGIRCEKAVIAMEQEGYEHVYQLEGGILAYLQQFPDEAFQGECFVFDRRVAVDQHLRPSRTYGICPHCGNPGTLKITCAVCERQAIICHKCNMQGNRRTCSKNCTQIGLRHAQKNHLATAKSQGYGEQ